MRRLVSDHAILLAVIHFDEFGNGYPRCGVKSVYGPLPLSRALASVTCGNCQAATARDQKRARMLRS